MKIAFFLLLLSLPAFGQDSMHLWADIALPSYQSGMVVPAKDTEQLIAILIPPGKSIKIVDVVYDSTWQITEYNNTNAAIVYSSGWLAGTGQAKFINSDFQYGGTLGTVRTAVLTVTLDQQFRIGLLSEHYSGHGDYTIQIDSGPLTTVKAGIAPFGSDKDLNTMSFKSAVLEKGTHKITVSSSQQMVIDAFRILKLTLVPR